MSVVQLALSVLLNVFTAASALFSVGAFFRKGGRGNMQKAGTKALIYFTVDSNLLCALACLGVCVWELAALFRGGGLLLPRWLDLCKFAGASAVGVTFFTTLCYLLPVLGFDFKLLYAGRNCLLHLLCPLAAMLSWALLERGEALRPAWALLAVLPTALYALVYLRMVLLRKQWEDFYRFNTGGRWYLSAAAMLTLSLLIGFGLLALRG